ncbi:MAG: hypothetical protein JW951_08605 [Lentisphaerae bacterium]|nr:hypothetical protein [Lentisphaerota bacterium]
MRRGQSATLSETTIRWDGSALIVECGTLRREWSLTACGLATYRLAHGHHTWIRREPRPDDCDWRIWQMIMPRSCAELVDVRVSAMDRPRLTAAHVSATAEFSYPREGLAVRYTVQAYPSACGVRTQLQVRALRPFTVEELPSHLLESYGEYVPVRTVDCTRTAMGYYNDAQHRNHDDTPIMRRERRVGGLAETRREIYDWASLLSLQNGEAGLVWVKESPKCVNQQAIDTGAFVLHPDDLRVTGLGLKATCFGSREPWLPYDRFRHCWANWCVPYTGGEAELQLAVKRFDRARFLPHPERRVYSRSNTWGTRPPGVAAQGAANQDDVLKEIASCADLSIDAVAIDDGWQAPLAGGHFYKPDDWRPHPERFPDGWSTVRRAAADAGVDLQLWIAGTQAPLEHMIRNVEQGGFSGLKIDFLDFPAREDLDRMMDKVERLVKHMDYTLGISWDVTENSSRVGYYYGREYGSLHTSNRKPDYASKRVRHVVYTPRLVLRDAWHLAHYLNLNQVEIPVQNVAHIDPAASNAAEYAHAYCAAMAVVGLPLFFQETHLLEGRARDETRRIMQTWREHRAAMARAYVFPIGDEPCDEAWTGFQCHDPETGSGYVLLFRELRNREAQHTVALHFIGGRNLAWHDVLGGQHWKAGAPLECAIDRAPGFRWFRYEPA